MSDTFNTSLRMPEEMGNIIYEMAKEEKRSMNTVICLLLEKAIKEKQRKRKSGKKLHIQDNTSN